MKTQGKQTMLLGALALGLFFGCSPNGHTSSPAPQPDLCDLDGGRWCTPCGRPGQVQCPVEPQKDSGWLCCSGGVCIAVPLAGDCTTGTVGWCTNYTTSTTPAGNKVSTCHDEP
jgi:hypothetical protein